MIRDEHAWINSLANHRVATPPEAAVVSPASRFAVEPRSGQSITFRMADVYAPPLPDLFKQITPNMELQGRVILLSDSGESQAAYALVEVKGVLLPLIVPASCLEAVAGE